MSAWNAYLIVMGIVFGSILGSYLTMAIYRVPRRIDIVRGGSRCTTCGASLTAWDNIPILGYLIHRGRCRHCGVRIPIRYVLIEVAAMVAFTAVAFVNPWFAIYLFIAAVMIPAIIQWVALPASRGASAIGHDSDDAPGRGADDGAGDGADGEAGHYDSQM